MLRSSASSLPAPPPFSGGLRVAVIQGGPSSEAEVSRVSAAGVASSLARCGHDVTRLELDEKLPGKLLEGNFEVVFPVVHGAIGEDGCLQGLLELLGLAYVGAGVLASALANDKIIAKRLFRAEGLPVAEEVVLRRGAPLSTSLEVALASLGHALVVKPATQGSALGVTPLADISDVSDPRLGKALDDAFALDERVLLERFVQGREVTCGVLDLEGQAEALPPTEIKSKRAGWYDYTSRYGSGGSEHTCPAALDKKTFARVQDIAVRAHQVLCVRDMSRADFIVGFATADSEPEIVLLEVNTLPGMTPTSLLPEAAAVAGVSFDLLCHRLVRRAATRGVRAKNAPVTFPT